MNNIQKKSYEYIFIVVTYRNGEDLFDFDKSLKKNINNYKVIIVNNFMNDETEKRIKEISDILNYDFISSENKGYGAGNNKGIEYALSKYDFNYIIISNSDIVIKKFDTKKLPTENAVIGPKIITINGKYQNPYWVLENKSIQKILYNGFKKNSKLNLIISQGINKIIRELFLLLNKNKKKAIKTYAVHGAFLIITKDVINKIHPLYDENMFLYYEEAYLAKKCKNNNIKKYFYPEIEILHKEDGSTKGSNINLNGHATNSFKYYFEKNYKKGK